MKKREYRNLTAWVFRNLHHKGVVWSVKDKSKTILHSNHILIRDAEFIVRKGGQSLTRQRKQRNVHAFVKGTLVVDAKETADMFQKINKSSKVAYYNPYKTDTFVGKDGKAIFKAKYVLLTNDGDKSKVSYIED